MNAFLLAWAMASAGDAYHEWHPRWALMQHDVVLYTVGAGDLVEIESPNLVVGIARRMSGAAPYPPIVIVLTEDPAVGDAEIAHITQFVYVWDVNLSGTNVTDDGMEHIAHLERLRYLRFEGEAITDKGAELISTIMTLEKLHLVDTEVSDQGVASIAKLARLEHLSLHHTEVTDAAVDSLIKMKKLDSVDLRDTRVTKDGVLRLRLHGGISVFCDPEVDVNPRHRRSAPHLL